MSWRFVLLKKVINQTRKRRVLNEAMNIIWSMDHQSPERIELQRIVRKRLDHIKGS